MPRARPTRCSAAAWTSWTTGIPPRPRCTWRGRSGCEPGRNSIRETLGRAEFAAGRFERAAELFAAVVADVPDSDYAHYALARCLRLLGRGEEARGHLRLARALHPTSEIYRQRLDGVD